MQHCISKFPYGFYPNIDDAKAKLRPTSLIMKSIKRDGDDPGLMKWRCTNLPPFTPAGAELGHQGHRSISHPFQLLSEGLQGDREDKYCFCRKTV